MGTLRTDQPNYSDSIKVLQANLMRSHASHHEFIQYFLSNEYDIALITEPYVGNSHLVHNIRGIRIFQFPNSQNTRIKACVLIRENIEAALGISQHSTPNLAVVQVTVCQRKVTFISAYFEPPVSGEPDPSGSIPKFANILSMANHPNYIIGMDANGDSPEWGSPESDERGAALTSIAASHNLQICNSGNLPTFEAVRHQRHCSSIIDVTMASEYFAEFINSWHVNMSAVPSSDHHAIEFHIKVPKRINQKSNSTYLFNNKTARWDIFHEKLELLMTESGLLENPISLSADEKAELLTSVVREACFASMKLRGNGGVYTPFWNVELEERKKDLIRLHHEIAGLKAASKPTDEKAEIREVVRKEYAKMIRKASSDNFREFCNKQGPEDVWSLTNRLIKDSPTSQPAGTLRTPGGFTANSQDTADTLLHHFYPDDGEDAEIHREVREKAGLTSTGTPDPPFTEDEIKEGLHTMNPNRAPGHDNLTSDICAAVFEHYPEYITSLMNEFLEKGEFPKIWKEARVRILQKPGKSDYSELSSLRPIGLLPVFGKLLEKLMIKRMVFRARHSGHWVTTQFGFREQTSTNDALRNFVESVKSAKSAKMEVMAISFDIKGAFDNAWWPAIHEELRRNQCPSNIHKLIQSYLSDRLVTLEHSDAKSSKYTNKGCIQGSVCGPHFWNLVMDVLLRKTLPDGCHLQAFADDIILIISGNSTADVQAKVSTCLSEILEWGEIMKLSFSLPKTQAIAFTKGLADINIVIGDHTIEFVKVIKYLGVMIDSNLNFVEHSKYIIKKATKIFNKLSKFVRPTWGVHPKNVDTIYRRVIEPIICYAAGIWGVAASRYAVRNRLRSFQRTFAIRAIRAFHTVSAVSATTLAGFTPLHLKVKEQYEIDQVKFLRTYSGIPEDRLLEIRCTPENLLHPADRISVQSASASDPDSAKELESETNIFTDGSKLETGEVGAAFVIYHPNGRQEPRKYKLDKTCTVFQAEALAIQKALEWASKYAKSPNLTIFSDSLSALQALADRSNSHPIIAKIHRLLKQLENRISVTFTWVKAHVGIPGNEAADEQAKLAGVQRRPPEYTNFPISYAKHEIRQRIHEEWEAEYQTAEQGSTTRRFFPTVKSALEFREFADADYPEFQITQILTGHGFNKSYLKRFNITADDACPCDESTPQDLDHLLHNCPKYQIKRNQLEAELNEDPEFPGIRSDNPDLSALVSSPRTFAAFASFFTHIVDSLKLFNGT